MFKELGEFIVNVGYVAKRLLSRRQDLCGGIGPTIMDDEQIDELVKKGLITKEEGEAIKKK